MVESKKVRHYDTDFFELLGLFLREKKNKGVSIGLEKNCEKQNTNKKNNTLYIKNIKKSMLSF